jgi:type I restriction enzyme R subunit
MTGEVQFVEVVEIIMGQSPPGERYNERVEGLGLSENELAFYYALETNDSAVKVLGNETLRVLVKRILLNRSLKIFRRCALVRQTIRCN